MAKDAAGFDAAGERECLAHALAAFQTAGWAGRINAHTEWYHRRVRRLAAACALPLDRVRADLERDAEVILAGDEF